MNRVLTEIEQIKQQISAAIYKTILPHMEGEHGTELLCLQLDLVRTLHGIKPVEDSK